ncbi:MAG: Gfo/Idh/MocA family oxidoreductase [candidate division KSB1 bacterium]|nr:Gfo/Idh/MocA family oxidoreductase [candidate division KSB1 bacterium]MDZ7276226.1 Gfo/Idh/MocA family oxidoreductase [candidate division KSB1 bacterium]MDZ7287968.1 Gfo/Idh/MocA family oxidoreductase [candidate division KSB1 bacterium]MDZ7300019.1 Gfo/Idh/MocA family oxidoreductase [candidate division KSB1 bacterium]MDZ7308560.1 Gfo/Idh/MocA family oxidoreductase [candidate division KSB1 bacterium]
MSAQRKIRFGIIGGGLMGREFAVACGRWPALLETKARPEIVAICDLNEQLFDWYTGNFSSIKLATRNHQELLAAPEVEAVYCAVPHHLHEQIYCDILAAGKHLLGEKPFGIDLAANQRILAAIQQHPELFVRCSSEYPFYPGGHRMHQYILANPWGRIIAVNSGYLHSSDLNFNKPINWKRTLASNGEYGCLGDLGMHALHLPIRARWIPTRLHATLVKIVTQRPDGKGGMAPCETWDNATLQCEVMHPTEGYTFPMTVKTWRIAPGETDTWYLEVLGTQFSARYSTKFTKTLQTMRYENGGPQAWQHEDLGYASAYPTVTGGIFEFGFTDAILQMWAAFLDELNEPRPHMPFGCMTPEETLLQHKILTAALHSGRTGNAVAV